MKLEKGRVYRSKTHKSRSLAEYGGGWLWMFEQHSVEGDWHYFKSVATGQRMTFHDPEFWFEPLEDEDETGEG
jgi:hypothetical protein